MYYQRRFARQSFLRQPGHILQRVAVAGAKVAKMRVRDGHVGRVQSVGHHRLRGRRWSGTSSGEIRAFKANNRGCMLLLIELHCTYNIGKNPKTSFLHTYL